MNKLLVQIPNLYFVLPLLLLFLNWGEVVKSVHGQKTWCVAKPSTNETALRDNIEFACSNVNCSSIDTSQPCFLPNTLISHASVVMNLYYQSHGRSFWNCHFSNSGLITIIDPSYANCKYA